MAVDTFSPPQTDQENSSPGNCKASCRELFPEITSIGGEEMVDGKPLKPTYDSPRSYCTLAIEELGLKTHSIEETVKATIDSYLELDMI